VSARTVLLAAVVAVALPWPAAAEPMRRVRGSVPPALAALEPLGRAPADLRLDHVTLVLGLRDRAGLDSAVAAQQDRRSPRFHQWLDAAEIADRFGPRPEDYERVRRWLVEHGLEVVRESPLRLTLVVAGSAAQVESGLGVPIGLFRRRGRVHHGPLAAPLLPESVAASVRGVIGLDDLPTFHPLAQLGGGVTALAPADFAAAYDVTTLQSAGLTGAGHSVAVIARSNFADSDVAAFASRFLSRPLAPVRVFTGGTDPGILADQGEQIEVLLDTQWAGALAPGATLNVMIGSSKGNVPEALEAAIVNRSQTPPQPSGDVVSVSFGLCEPLAAPVVTELFDDLYAIGNAQGQTIVVASGDDGANDCAPQGRAGVAVNALASSPHALAVGGTSFDLSADGQVPSDVVESVWNDNFGASGGGRSAVFAMPAFQQAAGLDGFGPSRVLPDIAVAASPRTPGYVIVQGGRDRIVGGTSAGVPSMAGTLALMNERLAATAGRTGGLGQLVPELYRLASEQMRGMGPAVFRDVTSGATDGFAASPGFDLATGWGAPLAGALVDALGAPGRCEPAINGVRPEAGCLVPSNRGRKGCAGEWLVEQDRFAVQRGLPAVAQTCRDGDPQCDADGAADGRCTLRVALCVNVSDFRILKRRNSARATLRCQPGKTRRVQIVSPGARAKDPTLAANRASAASAIAGLPLPTDLANACTATVPVTVPAGARLRLAARVSGSLGQQVPRVILGCTP